jgi:hypothetical protein
MEFTEVDRLQQTLKKSSLKNIKVSMQKDSRSELLGVKGITVKILISVFLQENFIKIR